MSISVVVATLPRLDFLSFASGLLIEFSSIVEKTKPYLATNPSKQRNVDERRHQFGHYRAQQNVGVIMTSGAKPASNWKSRVKLSCPPTSGIGTARRTSTIRMRGACDRKGATTSINTAGLSRPSNLISDCH